MSGEFSPDNFPGGLSALADDLPPLVECIDVLDEAHISLVAACETFAENPGQEAILGVQLCGALLIDRFQHSIRTLIGTIPEQTEQLDFIAQIMKNEDEALVAYFRSRCDYQDFTRFEDPDEEGKVTPLIEVIGTLHKQTDSGGPFIEQVADLFKGSLMGDLNHFAYLQLEKHYRS